MNVLAPILLELLEYVRVTCDVPEQFCVSALTPILKRGGDAAAPSSYRGLAVGGALGKLYAVLLDKRLARFGEANDARCPFQAGSRSKRSTMHNLFMVRHLKARSECHFTRGTLFVCQIDFEKAFDTVPRALLWRRLEERGIHGPMLAALQAAYQRVLLRVKVNGRLGPTFASVQGVKQGCPMSPNLFGFFVEILADYLEARDCHESERMRPWEAAFAGERRVPLLFYADDLSLLCTCPTRLREVLGVLTAFCDAFGMRVNASKSEVMVFHRDADVCEEMQRRHQFSLGGRVIPYKPRVRYLGVHFGPRSPFASCTAELHDAGRRALFALNARLDGARLYSPRVRVACFDVQVRSVLSYAAEIWGPDELHRLFRLGASTRRRTTAVSLFEEALKHPMCQLQKDFLKRCCGARVPPLRLLFRELGQLPLHYHWLKLACSFWNRLVADGGSPYFEAFVADVKLALREPGKSDSWAGKLIPVLERLGYEWPAQPGRPWEKFIRHQLVLPDILKAFERLLVADWARHEAGHADPRLFDGSGVTMCRYVNWMGLPVREGEDGVLDPGRYQGVYLPVSSVHAIARFRLCAWPLEVYRAAGVRVRSERYCRVCSGGHMEDEYHVVFECSAYGALRDGSGLDFSQRDFRRWWCVSEPALLGRFLVSVLSRRAVLMGALDHSSAR